MVHGGGGGGRDRNGMERKQLIVDVLVLPLLPKQKKTMTMMITLNNLAVSVEWRCTLQGSINDNNNKDGPDGI